MLVAPWTTVYFVYYGWNILQVLPSLVLPSCVFIVMHHGCGERFGEEPFFPYLTVFCFLDCIDGKYSFFIHSCPQVDEWNM